MELAFLEPVLRAPGPWASAFAANAGTGPNSADQQQLAAREVRDQLLDGGAPEADAEAVHRELARLDPDHPGRAVYAAGGRVVQTVPLNCAPPLPEGQWGTVPHVAPLVERAEDPRICLVAYVDRQGADFEVRHADGHEPAGDVSGRDWPLHRTPAGGWSERHFQNAVENTWEENAALTADELGRHAEETGPDVVLLVGDERQRRSVHERLPHWLQPRVVETDHGGRSQGARTRLLDEEVNRLLARERRHHQRQVLDRLQAGLNGAADAPAAVEGVPALIEAAREHRVATLLLAPSGPDPHREIWAGAEPDQLSTRRGDLRYLGAGDPFGVRADDALLRAVAAAGGEAVFLSEEDHAATGLPSGGMGALLRWSHGDHPDRGETARGTGTLPG